MSDITSVIQEAAMLFGVLPADITARYGSHRFGAARAAVTWIARNHLKMTHDQIARRLSWSVRSTSVDAYQRAERFRASKPAFREITDKLAQRVAA